MKNIGVNDGHTIRGIGSGAIGIINESEETRKVGAEVRRLINESGNKAVNCTVDYASTVLESLSRVVDMANDVSLDWFVALHFNAGGGRGVEVYTYKGRQYQDAIDVCENISELGFNNRGVKEGSGLYVIRKTAAKSMLIEVCFVDTDDANKYLQIGYKEIAKAIVKALIGYINETKPSIPVDTTTEKKKPYEYGIVTAENGLYVRAGNSTKCPILGSLKKGEKVHIDYESNGWYSVFWGEHGGWISSKYVAEDKEVSKPVETTRDYEEHGNATVLANKLNVRTAPSTSAEIVASYYKGEVIRNYDHVYDADGYRWIRYVGASGNYRFIAVRELNTNRRYADCY